jgi:cyclic pyranopterin phosphate synthase
MSLMPILRKQVDDTLLREAIVQSMGIKPKEHNFNDQMDAPKVVRFMSMTGG